MKIAVVTGAGIRIGKGIADGMLAAGYELLLHAHASFSELSRWVDAHPRKNQVLDTVNADLRTAEGQDYLCAAIKARVSHIDVLINSASMYTQRPFEAIEREQFRNMQAVNLEAPFFITQSLLPLLRQGPKSSVINIIDALWERPSSYFADYAASKAGLAILTRALAKELAPEIRVNGVAPGAILFAPFVSSEQREKIIQKIPFKRSGEVKDIAEAVVFLSEQARYITGEILVVDGGRSLAS